MERIGARNIALVVLTVVTAVLLILAIQRQNAGPTAATTDPVPPPRPPSNSDVAFIGDSFTSGTPDGGLGRANYTGVLAARERWTVTNAAVDGAGYVTGPRGKAVFSAQVERVVAAQPSLVVVVGGRTDVGAGLVEARGAAYSLFRELKNRLPQAKIVVIGPIWPGEDAPPEMLTVRDGIRESAESFRLPFLDPIQDEWFIATDDPGATPDRGRLNDIGHQGMVDLVGEGLRRLGATPQPSASLFRGPP